MKQLLIEAENVTFIGSSGGGYSALFLGNMLDNSSVIVINPQLILKYWQYPHVYNNFKEWGIDLDSDDDLGRNKICLTNKTVTFLICINYKSDADYKVQFKEFSQNHERKINTGMKIFGQQLQKRTSVIFAGRFPTVGNRS